LADRWSVVNVKTLSTFWRCYLEEEGCSNGVGGSDSFRDWGRKNMESPMCRKVRDW